MRFDDSLKTVLAADTTSAFGAQSAFRQIVDLMGRGRIADDATTLETLASLRKQVPLSTRAGAARALALAEPPAALVSFFASDVPVVAAPVLRIARLDDAEWIDVLPSLSPLGRAILRDRRDLGADVVRALAAFGSTDFTIGTDVAPPEVRPAPAPATQPATPPVGVGPFVPLGSVARELPIVAEALRQAAEPPAPAGEDGRQFEIAELVDRIATFQRGRSAAPSPAAAPPPAGFRFESDAHGIIRFVDGVSRGALVGLSLADADPRTAVVDGSVSGGLRKRAAVRDGRLTVAGGSDAAGEWRISTAPIFDATTGRFLGVRGQARRPRGDESAVCPADGRASAEALRRLVHELRTPTNAIAGFAELIEGELLGAVPDVHRARASAIRGAANGLVGAIEDIETAARIEGDALELRGGAVALASILAEAERELAALVSLRGCVFAVHPAAGAIVAYADDRALSRLIRRLLAAIVSTAQAGEAVRVTAATAAGADPVGIAISRPAALANVDDDALLSIDAEGEAALPGAPLLGTGFAIRLARNLARELGGALAIEPRRLTLMLPAALNPKVGQASTN